MTDQRSKVILGYSGLHGSAEFKAANFPELDSRAARLFQGLDSAAALLVDGQVVAAVQQERYSGVKFDHGFPADAIRSTLRIAGVDLAAVDAIAHNFDYSRFALFSRGGDVAERRYADVHAPDRQTRLLHRFLPELSAHTVVPVPHHQAHALTAAIPSGFDECLVVVMDGMGELHAVSVYAWRHGRLDRLRSLDFRSSLGLFYALVTMHLGYLPNSDEYKVMALAATGDPSRYREAIAEALVCGPDGRLDVPVLRHNRDEVSRETFAGSRAWLAERTCPERRSDEALGQAHRDLAAAAQHRLEEAMTHLLGYWVHRSGLRRVAFAGGVALNCSAIGKIASSGLVDAV